MKQFQIIYDKNKKLDNKYEELYGLTEEIIKKNKLELCIEIGELANETKCFKYWSIKKGNKEEILEEYADCLLMTFFSSIY